MDRSQQLPRKKPVIRQRQYVDKDIFVSESVSNCADAISKYEGSQHSAKSKKELIIGLISFQHNKLFNNP